MNNEEQHLADRLHLEVEMLDMNRLTNLGNQAQALGLIDGHGYRGGHYEILRHGEFLLFSAVEAQVYLQQLVKELTNP
jgi:hypothetical protein